MSLGTNIPLYGQNKDGSALGHASHGVSLIDSDTTLTEADSGSSIVVLNNAGITIKLPAPVKGMCFDFAFVLTAAEAQNTVIDTQSDTYYLRGGVPILDTDATADGAEALVPVLPNGSSNSKMTLVTPDNGTWVRMVSDGVHWFCYGIICSSTAAAVTYADQ